MKNGNYYKKLSHALATSKLLERKDRILVGVSGGPDSMALLEVLRALAQRYQWKIVAAHCNHLLRGKASDKDEEFVRDWCSRRGIAFLSRRVNTAAQHKQQRRGLEDAARELRYAFLEESAQVTRSNKIVLAHTADDQAETILWRILRGSVRGLSGIPAKRSCKRVQATIVRPLLSIPKKDILAFLREQKLSYRVDKSNKKTHFTRNRIRNNLLPYLRKHFSPAIVSLLNRTAYSMARQREVIEALSQKALRKGILRVDPTGAVVQIAGLLRLPEAVQAEILLMAYEASGAAMENIKNQHVQRMLVLSRPQQSAKEIRIGTACIQREQKNILFVANVGLKKSFVSTALRIPGTTPFLGGNVRTKLTRLRADRGFRRKPLPYQGQGSGQSFQECFDWDALKPPLTLRQRLPGDRYSPIGLKGSKKVKDILMDEKIPLSQRDNHLVLQDASGKVLWLTGHRIAEHCKIRPNTRKTLSLHLNFGLKRALA